MSETIALSLCISMTVFDSLLLAAQHFSAPQPNFAISIVYILCFICVYVVRRGNLAHVMRTVKPSFVTLKSVYSVFPCDFFLFFFCTVLTTPIWLLPHTITIYVCTDTPQIIYVESTDLRVVVMLEHAASLRNFNE